MIVIFIFPVSITKWKKKKNKFFVGLVCSPCMGIVRSQPEPVAENEVKRCG